MEGGAVAGHEGTIGMRDERAFTNCWNAAKAAVTAARPTDGGAVTTSKLHIRVMPTPLAAPSVAAAIEAGAQATRDKRLVLELLGALQIALSE